MIAKLSALGDQTLADIESSQDLQMLDQVRIAVLGKKGALSEILRSLSSADPSERRALGAAANELKQKIEDSIEARKKSLEATALAQQLRDERIDLSAPARRPHMGSLHLITQTTRRVIQVFARLGFDVTLGPEAETEYLNFEAVNIAKDHPARDMQDTFFLGPGVVLRTHTSSVQMRAMRSQKWPLRIVCPGTVYRADDDATHSPMFHQVEALWVDQGVTMSDLKGTLLYFATELFGKETRIRLRPSYFPFVEPGAEVDVSCFQCRQKISAQCRVCRGSGWLEILGAGMVHPRLFEMAGYEQGEDVTGFAFGMGIERIAMLLYQVPDLRLLFQNDIRFLSQF